MERSGGGTEVNVAIRNNRTHAMVRWSRSQGLGSRTAQFWLKETVKWTNLKDSVPDPS